MSPKRWLLLVALVVAVAALSLSGVAAQVTAAARALAAAAGPAGPLVFAAAYVLATLLAVPGGPLTILAGVLFGPVLGSATAVGAATVGATAAFALGRRLGRDRVEALLERRTGRLQRLDRWMTGRGFAAILLLRLVPVVPFNMLNYVAGLSGVRPRDYVPATAVGIIPGTVVYAALGGTVHDPTSPAFVVAVALFVALVAVTVLLRRRFVPTVAPVPPTTDERPDARISGGGPSVPR